MSKRMMTSMGGIIITVVLGATLSRATLAADEKGKDRTTGFFIGKISAVDGKDRIVKVKSDTSEMTFQIAADAKIVGKDGKEASLSDLKVDENVTLNYSEENDVMVAHQITLTESKPLPPPPPVGDDKPIGY